LEEAGVELVDLGTSWSDLVETGKPIVLHDPLCPMTPASFLAACVTRAVAQDCVVVGVRPVTDTVKVVTGEYVGGTVDRSTLLQVVSPVVLPASAAAALDAPPEGDFAELVATLAERFRVETVEAPAEARRVADDSDLRVLEAFTRPG
jgi:2-C-methyl-D-erythritol 4-phosphate cytidylyltransferase